MEIVGNIYKETDYSKFKKLPNNRDVLSGRIGRLKASIGSKWIMNPIIVNEKHEIIDGQGRYEACKTLSKPIYYIMVQGLGIDECRQLNKYNSTWSILDFAKSYAAAGFSSYIYLLDACRETKLSIGRVLRITNHGRKSSTNDPSPLENGRLNFEQKDIEKAKLINRYANEISETLLYDGRKNDAFYGAITIMTDWLGDKYNHDRMLNNCKKCRNTYAQMSSLSDQLAEFERIYNYNARTSNKVYFTDYLRNKGRNVRDYNVQYSVYNDHDASTLTSPQ